jgi:hypothetical protein
LFTDAVTAASEAVAAAAAAVVAKEVAPAPATRRI